MADAEAEPGSIDATHAVVVVDGVTHRQLAMAAHTSCWDLLGPERLEPGPAQELLRRAYAAAYHWQRAEPRGPENEVRADYMIGKSWLAAGRPDLALESGDRVLEGCAAAGLTDFDLAYAHELRARALHALGRREEATQAWGAATAVPIADGEDREIVEADFADFDPTR